MYLSFYQSNYFAVYIPACVSTPLYISLYLPAFLTVYTYLHVLQAFQYPQIIPSPTSLSIYFVPAFSALAKLEETAG